MVIKLINYNAVKWLNDSNTKINDILKNNKIPIIVGGSGLYLEFLCDGINDMPKISVNTKDKVNSLLKNLSEDKLSSLIEKIDKKYSMKINIADKFSLSY